MGNVFVHWDRSENVDRRLAAALDIGTFDRRANVVYALADHLGFNATETAEDSDGELWESVLHVLDSLVEPLVEVLRTSAMEAVVQERPPAMARAAVERLDLGELCEVAHWLRCDRHHVDRIEVRNLEGAVREIVAKRLRESIQSMLLKWDKRGCFGDIARRPQSDPRQVERQEERRRRMRGA